MIDPPFEIVLFENTNRKWWQFWKVKYYIDIRYLMPHHYNCRCVIKELIK